MRLAALAIAWVWCAPGAGSQEPPPARHVPESPPGEAPSDDTLRDARLQHVVTLEERVPFVPPESAEAWFDRRDALRRQVLVAAGWWPEPPRGDLDPVIHGAVAREGCTVEKVFFRAAPGLYVTASLYRPTAPSERPRPGVLCPAGHPPGGRLTGTAEQARCVQLARMGAVVLHYDLIGHGDLRLLPHGEGFGDLEAELWAMSAFGLQTLCSLRALDLLESLPDVDRERLGVLAAGDRGTQALILGAIDDRPAAVFAGDVSPGSNCLCDQASHLRVGTSNVELAALVAPRPLGIVAEEDRAALERLYDMLGAPGRVTCPERESSGAVYAFFTRHLGLKEREEEPFLPRDPADLAVLDEAHPLPADAEDLAGVRAWLLEHAHAERERIEELARRDLREFRRVVRGALAVITHAERPVELEELEGAEGVAIVSLAGLEQRVTVWKMPPDLGPAVVLIVSPRLAIDWSLAPQSRGLCFVRHSAAMFFGPSAEPNGSDKCTAMVGGLLTEPDTAWRLPVDERHRSHPAYTWGHNATLLAHRVQDVLTGRLDVAETPGVQGISLVGIEGASPWAICAAALAPGDFERVVLQGGWDFDQITSLGDQQMLPGALRWGGLPAFAALIAPTPMLWLEENGPPRIVCDAYHEAWMATPIPRSLPTPLFTLVDAIDAWLDH